MTAKATNPQNLQPIRSKTKARELGRKGGIASGEAKRAKKTAYEIAKMFFDEKVTIQGKTYTRKELMVMNALKRINNSIMTKNANDTLSNEELKAFDYGLQMISEAPIPKTQQEVTVSAPIQIIDDVDKDTKPEGTE